MKQLIQSNFTKNGVRYDNVSSPANNGSLKQITSIEEDNGSFEYEVDGVKKKVQTEVVDNLNSIKTDVGLSANQGRVLNEKITNTDANVSTLTNQLVNKQNILTSVNEGKNITITNENGVPKINATGGGGGGTGDYDDLIHKPILKSDNAESLLPNANETIKGTISLHKVAKTGKFTDLNNITEANESQKGVIQVASDSEASTGTDTTKAINSKQLKTAIESINALQILNKGVLEATEPTVQDVATQYIVAEYGRQPKTNDSLIITFTDLGNDKIQYVYSSISNLWINVGRNDIDLTDYLKKTDVVDVLTSTETQKPLSANQGKVLNEHLTTTDDEINNLTAEVSDLATNKQDKLTTANAGTNVTITEEGGVTKINAEGGSGGTSVLVGGQPQTTWNADLKQNKLVAGENITIDESTNTISASGGSSYVPEYIFCEPVANITTNQNEPLVNFAVKKSYGNSDRLTISNGNVKIGKGITKVKVCCNVTTFRSTPGSAGLALAIKNKKPYIFSGGASKTTDFDAHSISICVANVVEGDEIEFLIGGINCIFYAGINFSNMLVEVLE